MSNPASGRLFDGKTMNGWKLAEENQRTWRVEDGALVANGERCHLFYAGDMAPFKNFHLKVEVMTGPYRMGAFFSTPNISPKAGRRGLRMSGQQHARDWIKTGACMAW
jgi:hypothetical protein